MSANGPERSAAAADLEIRPVSGRRDLARFIRLPRTLYQGLPGYRPRLDYEQRQVLDPRLGPFFDHGRASYWLARRNGRLVGRISAQIDDLAPLVEGKKPGFFGCLDAIDDAALVAALLATAENWLADNGAGLVRGPFTLSINGESGLMLAGQTSLPMVLMGWAPSYLAGHVATAGYRLAKRLYAYRLPLSREENAHAAALRNRLIAGRIALRGLNMADLTGEAEMMRTLFNDAWADNWGFTPMAKRETGTLLHSMRPVLSSDWCAVCERDGRPIAFALLLPNLEEILQHFGGRLLPFNWLRLAWWVLRRRYRTGRIILFGVSREFRGSVLGASVPLILIDELLRRGTRWHVMEIELGWVLEDNAQVRALIEKVGGIVDKLST